MRFLRLSQKNIVFQFYTHQFDREEKNRINNAFRLYSGYSRQQKYFHYLMFQKENITKVRKIEQPTTNKRTPIITSLTPPQLPHVKSLDFLQEVIQMKENCGIKAGNHINNVKSTPLIDSPEVVGFILEAIKQYNKAQLGPLRKNECESENLRSSRSMMQNKTPRKNMELERKGMIKLKEWLEKKMKYQKIQEKTGATIITERIQSLNFAYYETCQFAGRYCQEMGDIFTLIHNQYHKIYQYVIECLTKHNLTMKKEIDVLQQKIREKISYYEKQLLDIRIVHEEKSSKVIENFHRCINMKQHFERQAKKYTTAYTKEKNKLKFFEEALVKALNIILQIGNQKFHFLEEEKVQSINLQEENKLKMFNRWCLSIIRNIIQLNKEKSQLKDKNGEGRKEIENVALTVITKFMVDFDPSLSVDDARKILMNYSVGKNIQVDEIGERKIQAIEKIEITKVPDIKQLCEQYQGIDFGIQTNIQKEKEDAAIQMESQKLDIGITVKPKVLNIETTTAYWLQNKLKVQKVYNEDLWVEKQKRSKHEIQRLKVEKIEKLNVKVLKAQGRDWKRQKKERLGKKKEPDHKTSLKISVDRGKNLKSNRQIFNDQALEKISNSSKKDRDNKSQKNKQPSQKKVLFVEENRRQSENSQFQIAFDTQRSLGSEKRMKSSRHFKTQRGIFRDYEEISEERISPTMTLINRQSERRRALIIQNNTDLIKSITRGRSFKKLEEEIMLSKRQIIKNKDLLLLNIIKIPEKIKSDKNRFLNPYEFKVELIAKLQQKMRVMTQNTMWPVKNMNQIVKISNKILQMKEKSILTIRNHGALFDIIRQFIEDTIGNYLKMYQQIAEYQTNKSNATVQKELLSGSKLPYYHRLAPLFYIIVNLTNPFGHSRFPTNLNSYFKGIALMKHHDKRLEILEQIFTGTSVELDIFIKTIYYLSTHKNAALENSYILLPIIELHLFFILDAYLHTEEIYSFIGELRNSCVKDEAGEKISFHNLLLKMLKTIKTKKKSLQKSYKNMFQILGYETHQSIPYSDLIYFLNLYPLDSKIRKKILLQASLFTIYWQKKEPCVPRDRLLFIFDSSRIQKNENSNENFLLEYLRSQCENNLSQLYFKIKANPFHAAQSLYSLFFKVPEIVHKRSQELRLGKNSESNLILLTVMYGLLIEGQMQKIYMPSFFNALSSIPL